MSAKTLKTLIARLNNDVAGLTKKIAANDERRHKALTSLASSELDGTKLAKEMANINARLASITQALDSMLGQAAAPAAKPLTSKPSSAKQSTNKDKKGSKKNPSKEKSARTTSAGDVRKKERSSRK